MWVLGKKNKDLKSCYWRKLEFFAFHSTKYGQNFSNEYIQSISSVV